MTMVVPALGPDREMAVDPPAGNPERKIADESARY
jgi:hypothetical protein